MIIKTPIGRLAICALELQPYNVSIQNAPEKANVAAETLSRPPRITARLSSYMNFPTMSRQATRQ